MAEGNKLDAQSAGAESRRIKINAIKSERFAYVGFWMQCDTFESMKIHSLGCTLTFEERTDLVVLSGENVKKSGERRDGDAE